MSEPPIAAQLPAQPTGEPPTSLPMTWQIQAAREPNRFWIRVRCAHGALTELAATNPGGAPPAGPNVVPTTALNLQRITGCQCSKYSPPFPPGAGGPPPYVTTLPATAEAPA